MRGIPTHLIDLNVITQDAGAGLPAKLRDASLKPENMPERLVVLVMESDVVSPSAWIRQALAPFPSDKVVTFRTIMAGPEFFEQGLNTPPAKLNEINAGLLNILRPARNFRVRTSSGTDLEITLAPERFRWVSNRGIPREGAFVFLPAGEVATYPAHISGTMVADGAFNTTAYTKLDARLENHPVVLHIEDGRLADFRCDNAQVQTLIERCMRLPNADRVGELGFGTNIGVQQFIARNSHLNERHPGLHIGFGQNTQGRHTLYECDVHLDLIASDCSIEIDGRPTLHSRDFKDLTGEHPAIEAGVFDEDLDGDCCGLFSLFNPPQCSADSIPQTRAR